MNRLLRVVDGIFFLWHYAVLNWRIRRGLFHHSPFTRSGFLHLLSALTWVTAPKFIVQLGVGEGVSTLVMGLTARLRSGNAVRLIGYDHFSERGVGEAIARQTFEDNLGRFGLKPYVELNESDVLQVDCDRGGIDFLNIDIDNNYEKLQRLYQLGWFDALAPTGLAIMEGGYSQHHGRQESRGIMRFCRELQERGFQTVTIQSYPGMVLVRKLLETDKVY